MVKTTCTHEEMSRHLEIEVTGYELESDEFVLMQTDDSTEATEIDTDAFKVPAVVLASLLGEYDEPDAFIGRKFYLALPA